MALLDPEALTRYVARQLSAFAPDRELKPEELAEPVQEASDRFARCFSNVAMKYVSPKVNHLHTDQYAVFLYYLSNTLHRRGQGELAAKAYATNKALHGVDLFFEVELPEVFALQHPVGTVLGRGRFSNHFIAYQRVSVGANLDNVYPSFGEGVVMFGGSAVIGRCRIGPNTWLSLGATVMDQDTPGDCVVFGRSPHLTIKPTRRNVVRDIFKKSGAV